MRTVGIGANKPKRTTTDNKLKKENELLKAELATVTSECEQFREENELLKAELATVTKEPEVEKKDSTKK